MRLSESLLMCVIAAGVGVGTTILTGYAQPTPPSKEMQVRKADNPLTPDLRHMATLIGRSQRLADVLSYSWETDQRTSVTVEDMALVKAAKDELEKDDADIQLNGLLGGAGMTRGPIKEGNGYYEIFERMKLPFSEGSVFEDGIADAAMLLPGELLRLPACSKDLKQVIFQAEAFPLDGKEAGLGLTFVPPIGYRVTAKELTPEVMQHRLVLKAMCLPPNTADKLN